jgi:DNA polymerase III subunit gamma/tau
MGTQRQAVPNRRTEVSGVSLYRTWRPKSFADLVGQDAVVRTLTRAIESGKLAHAYLFSGPRGSGKTSAAKILARCINCVQGPTAHPDNTCEFCVSMLEGTALDVLEIDAASNRGIDEIRSLREAVKFAPSVMRMKVYIIDEAHMLTKEGANAFLKTLEEPPPHAVFILATTEPERLPVTILSRCQRYAFRRISIPVMIERMREIARYEGIAIDDDALAAIAYRAEGGLRDALTMLEQAAAFADGPVTIETTDLAFGTSGREHATALLDAVLARDAVRLLQIIEEASDAGADLLVLTRSLITSFRNLLVAQIDQALLERDLAPEDAKSAVSRAATVSQPTIIRALRVLTDAAALARTGGNPRLELETALLRFILESDDGQAVQQTTAASPIVMPSSSREAPKPVIPSLSREAPKKEEPAVVIPSVAKRGRGTATDPSPAPKATAATTATPVTVQKLRGAWSSIRGKVEGERQSLRALLSGAMVAAVDGNTATIRMRNKFEADSLKPYVKLIEQAITDVLGAQLHVRLDVNAQAHAEPVESAPNEDEDVDELFNYANERIKRK